MVASPLPALARLYHPRPLSLTTRRGRCISHLQRGKRGRRGWHEVSFLKEQILLRCKKFVFSIQELSNYSNPDEVSFLVKSFSLFLSRATAARRTLTLARTLEVTKFL